MKTHVISAEQARRQGVTADQLIRCAEWHEDMAQRVTGPPQDRRPIEARHAAIAGELRAVAKDLNGRGK